MAAACRADRLRGVRHQAANARYFAYWGIPDIFEHITRSATTRGRLYLPVSELIDKRNNIAHGGVGHKVRRPAIREDGYDLLQPSGRRVGLENQQPIQERPAMVTGLCAGAASRNPKPNTGALDSRSR